MTDRERWGILDSLRGVALAGILLVNIPDLVGLGYDVPPGSDIEDRAVLDYAVQTRFIPIFTLLFGMSLVFVLRSARARGRRPWLALPVRLVSLFGIGLLHALVFAGDILRAYAVSGLILLPLVLLLPRPLQLLAGVAATIAAYALEGGGLLATPGLMLTGAALAAYEAPEDLETASRPVRRTFMVSAVLLVPALYGQSFDPVDPRLSTAGGVAGLVMATWYVCGLSLLWSTRGRHVIAAIFDPLGRMALSNYVGASLVVWLVARVVDFGTMLSVAPTSILAASILAGPEPAQPALAPLLPPRPARVGLADRHLAPAGPVKSRDARPQRAPRTRRADPRSLNTVSPVASSTPSLSVTR